MPGDQPGAAAAERGKLTASLNWDEHPVIQAVRRERADTAQKYFQMGVPLKVLNDYLDLELPACPGWEKGYLPFNLAPISGLVLPEKNPELAEPMDDAVALMRKALEQRRGRRRAGESCGSQSHSPGAEGRPVGELAQWRELMGQGGDEQGV